MTTKQAADIIRMLLGFLKGEIEPPKQETIEEARAFEQQGYECLEMAIKALEQQPCEDWYDVPSYEMTLEQARQAVKDLRKKLAEYLEQEPCDMKQRVEKEYLYESLCEDLKKANAEIKRLSEPFEDAISRQAVDELSKELVHTTRDKADFLCNFWEGLQKLPPVILQPCEDAISRQAVEKMIKAEMPERGMWEIEGDTVKETVCEVCVDLIQELYKLQPVTPKEKTGHWIMEDMFDGDVAYRCSECNELFWIESGTPKDNEYNFCPNCGARMVSE